MDNDGIRPQSNPMELLKYFPNVTAHLWELQGPVNGDTHIVALGVGLSPPIHLSHSLRDV